MPMYYLSVAAGGVPGTLELNGVPLTSWSSAHEFSEPVNMWVWAGTNQVRATLTWPEDQEFVRELARFQVTVAYADDPNKTFPESETILSYAWRPEDREEEETREDYPAVIELELEVSDAPASDLWPAAKPIDLDSAARTAVLDLTKSIHAAFEAQDADKVAGLLDFKAVDVGKAFHLSENDSRSGQKGFIRTALKAEGWAMLPCDDLQLTVVGQGKLVWVTREGGKHVIQSMPEKGPRMRQHLYIAPRDGTWTVVR